MSFGVVLGFSLVGAAVAGWAIGENAFVWNSGKWQRVNQCDSCKHIAPWPFMYSGKPCVKCGEEKITEKTMRWSWGRWIEKTRTTP